ncbi:MAG: alkaline phosphatase family protein, partial [Pseudomonadota bacterium]
MKTKHMSHLSKGKQFLFITIACEAAAVLCCAPEAAFAYIGPGAGFAVAGSFMVMFTAIITAVLLVLTWPVRYVIRAIRFGRIFARSRFKKVVVLGLDGMDYSLTKKWLDEGRLPNLARLMEQGCFKPLASTIPPISPVAWSSFQTGTNPGKHNIFDFLTRDRKTYAPKLSSSDIQSPAKNFTLGNYTIPLGKPDIRLLRKGIPFWKVLGDHGIFSSIIRVPITFPPEKFYGIQLSAMCTPDLRGTQGLFSYYTTEQKKEDEKTGGEFIYVTRNNSVITAALVGPYDPLLRDKKKLLFPFTLTSKDANQAELKINEKKILLTRGVYSDWMRIQFKASLGVRISGICRFLLLETEPECKLYVTPINIDPEKPAMPISSPDVYATYLSKRQGPYATLGLAEDSWALNEKLIGDDDFLQQCFQADLEREKMFFDSLENISRGLCVCVFDGTDRVQHAFWRQLDAEHPVHKGSYSPPPTTAVEEIYRRADILVGKTMEKCSDKDTLLLVISDHGFTTFRYGIDLNCWLEQNGYLHLKENGRNKKNLTGIDWSRTRAFAVGLSGIYLNLKGRESQGIVDPGKEAPPLRDEIAEKLLCLKDPLRNAPVIKHIYNAWKIYAGPYKSEAPDLIVGYHRGYRASWETAVGQVTQAVLHDNLKAWSGDHCIDQTLVPGVVFCNRAIKDEQARLMDIGPTVLDMFGV